MRTPLVAGVLVALAASLAACSALLGDFTVEAGNGPGADSGGDVGSSSGGDSGPDGATDAPVDAPPAPPVMKCVINGSPVTLGAPNLNTSERLALHAIKSPNGTKRRVMSVAGNSSDVTFVTIDESLSVGSIVSQPINLTASPQGLASYDGGFLALGLSQTGNQQLVALRYDDAAASPMSVVPITPLGAIPAASDLSIAAAPIGGDDFFVVYSYSTSVDVWSMYAGRARIAPGASPGVFKLVSDKISARPSLQSDLLVIDKPDNRAILFMGADKGQGAATVVQLDLTSGGQVVAPQPLPAIHGNSTFEPLAAQTNFGVADKVGLAFLEFDFNQANQPFYVYAGTFPAAGFSGFKMTSLPPPVSFANATDIAVDKGRAFWTHYPAAGSHVVAAARVTQSGKGVNFLWLDGAGNLRGKASGPDALVTGEAVAGAAGTMVDPPNQIIANAAITWLTDTGLIRIANVGCAK